LKPQRLYARPHSVYMNGEDIVRTPMRIGEFSRNAKPLVTFMSASIRSKRWIPEGVWPQYERTWLGESLVCQLFYQEQRWVATFLV